MWAVPVNWYADMMYGDTKLNGMEQNGRDFLCDYDEVSTGICSSLGTLHIGLRKSFLGSLT